MELASLAQLDRAHRRHDEVVSGLVAACRRLAAGRPEPTDIATVTDAIDFLGRAVPRHFLDEEGSVFPRLSTRRPELAETLAQLSAEHPVQIAMHNAITTAAEQIVDGRPGEGKAVLELAERLADLHRAHVVREDEILAVAKDAFSAEDDAEIVAEMETRRDRDGEGRGRGKGDGGGGGGGGGKRAKATKEKPRVAAAKTGRAPKQKATKSGKAKPAKKKRAVAKPKRRAR
jgi:hemerythrin-like domain-containing protein